jgi:hypothetical protein
VNSPDPTDQVTKVWQGPGCHLLHTHHDIAADGTVSNGGSESTKGWVSVVADDNSEALWNLFFVSSIAKSGRLRRTQS